MTCTVCGKDLPPEDEHAYVEHLLEALAMEAFIDAKHVARGEQSIYEDEEEA